MLVATIITYNDWPIIKDCVNSIYNKVDKIVIVDGKFWDFPGDCDYSRDKTMRYLLKLDKNDKFEICLAGGFTEVEKRNVYLDYLDDGDICLNLDADEILEGEIPDLDTDIGLIDIFEYNDRRRHRRYNRFFRFREGLHFYGKHYLILDKDNEVFTTLEYKPTKYTCKKIEGFHLLHKGKLRSPQRELQKKKYYKILQQREAKVCLN